MQRLFSSITIVSLLLVDFPACAGGGPQNVVLVVNAESWASLTVANEFIHLRGIPAGNVIYLENVPNFETIDINTFREKILEPVLKTIESRHLTGQADYLVYSADLPYAVDTSADNPSQKQPQVITRTASITGLTFLHERVMAKDTGYLRLNVNRYMRWVRIPQDTPFTEAEQKRYVESLGLLDPKKKKYDDALPILEELAKAHPKNSEVFYNLACCLSRLTKLDEACAALKASIDAGLFDAYLTREDDDLAALRDRPDFKSMLAQLEKTYVETQPALGFRARNGWDEKLEISADGKGEHYLLSTMLAVTSGRGTSVQEALNQLRVSVKSDGTRPAGTIYYLVNGDVRSKTRRWAFPSAVDQLKKLGVNAEIVQGVLPKGKPDVMGAMVGIADFDWQASGSTILPGAICEHLTSCGGELAQYRSQTACSVFLKFGAAGTSGAVQEPYALQQKFPSPFMHVHYARGCSLAESFFQSVSGPYQLIVVGDPLCAPWLRAPSVTLEGIMPNAIVKGTATLRPSAAQGDVGSFELYVDGLWHSTVKPGNAMPLNSADFADGFHRLSLVGISSDRIESQGRAGCNVTFDNHGQSVTLTAKGGKNISWNETLHLSAAMKGATSIALRANGRDIGQIQGEDGSIDVTARRLGLGIVTIQASGDSPVVRAASEPIEINIEPAWVPAIDKDPTATANGVRVLFDDGTNKVVNPAHNGKWLASAGLTRAHACTIDAWFNAPTDDLYQFQVQTPMRLVIEVDGTEQPLAETKAWQFVPMALRKGAHHFRIKANAANADPFMDLRFGASGTHSIEGKQFQCNE